jgi:hypothetical protein
VTAPVGYRDWIRSFATSRSVLLSDFANTISANRVVGPLNTVNVHSVGLKIIPTNNHLSVFLDWYMDAGLVNFLTSDKIDTRQSIGFDQTITVKGAFVVVTIIPRGGVSSTYTLVMWEMPYESVSQANPTNNMILTVNGASVAATTTTNFGAAQVWVAPASFTAYSSDSTNWNIALQSIDASGATRVITRVQTGFPAICQTVYLPSCPVQVACTNNDGVARFFFAFLNGKPLYP